MLHFLSHFAPPSFRLSSLPAAGGLQCFGLCARRASSILLFHGKPLLADGQRARGAGGGACRKCPG